MRKRVLDTCWLHVNNNQIEYTNKDRKSQTTPLIQVQACTNDNRTINIHFHYSNFNARIFLHFFVSTSKIVGAHETENRKCETIHFGRHNIHEYYMMRARHIIGTKTKYSVHVNNKITVHREVPGIVLLASAFFLYLCQSFRRRMTAFRVSQRVLHFEDGFNCCFKAKAFMLLVRSSENRLCATLASGQC